MTLRTTLFCMVCLLLPTVAQAQKKKAPPKQKMLVMVIHSVEFPNGNAMGQKACTAALATLNKTDTFGVLIYGQSGLSWLHPPEAVGDGKAAKAAIGTLQAGDMPDFSSAFRQALAAFKTSAAGAKQMILISDGDPSPPSTAQLKTCKQQSVTVSTVCYFSHGGAQGPGAAVMKRIASYTGGKYHYADSSSSMDKALEALLQGRDPAKGSGAAPDKAKPEPTSHQGVPVRNWLLACKKGDLELFKTVFSKRMQAVFEKNGWKEALTRYQEFWTKEFGDYAIGEFRFSYQGEATAGKVSVVHKGKTLPGLKVVLEDGAWRVDER